MISDARAPRIGLALSALAACLLVVAPAVPPAHADEIPGSAAGPASVAPLTVRPFPPTGAGVSIFADQLSSGMSEALYRFAATHYAGTQKMLQRDADHLRQYNPGMVILHYRLGLGASDASVRIIDGNQWITDFATVNAHESWFYHLNGSRVFKTDSHYYLMNPTTGWRGYWLSRLRTEIADNHDDAVFADSTSVPNYLGTSDWSPPLPPYDPTFEGWWSAQIGSLLAAARANLGGARVIPNAGYWITTRDATDYSQADGVMIEGFGEWSAHHPFALGDWQLEMNRVLSLDNKSRIIIAQNYLDSVTDLAVRRYYLGNYLLIKGGFTYLNYFAHGFNPEWYPEWGVPIGSPASPLPSSISALYDAQSGLYRRAYSNGLVAVNPTTAAHTLNLGGTYYLATPVGGGTVPSNGDVSAMHLTYTPVTSVTVAANDAAILVHTLPPGS